MYRKLYSKLRDTKSSVSRECIDDEKVKASPDLIIGEFKMSLTSVKNLVKESQK